MIKPARKTNKYLCKATQHHALVIMLTNAWWELHFANNHCFFASRLACMGFTENLKLGFLFFILCTSELKFHSVKPKPVRFLRCNSRQANILDASKGKTQRLLTILCTMLHWSKATGKRKTWEYVKTLIAFTTMQCMSMS